MVKKELGCGVSASVVVSFQDIATRAKIFAVSVHFN
jgi:hypothetical protein